MTNKLQFQLSNLSSVIPDDVLFLPGHNSYSTPDSILIALEGGAMLLNIQKVIFIIHSTNSVKVCIFIKPIHAT